MTNELKHWKTTAFVYEGITVSKLVLEATSNRELNNKDRFVVATQFYPYPYCTEDMGMIGEGVIWCKEKPFWDKTKGVPVKLIEPKKGG